MTHDDGKYLAETLDASYKYERCVYCGTSNGNHWFCSCGCHHSGPCGKHAQPECDRPG